MSMQPRPWPDVPELTGRMARASSPKGNLAMRIREELGEVYADARFAAASGVRGRPGISPGQLMMASVLQFSENLTDRQARASFGLTILLTAVSAAQAAYCGLSWCAAGVVHGLRPKAGSG